MSHGILDLSYKISIKTINKSTKSSPYIYFQPGFLKKQDFSNMT